MKVAQPNKAGRHWNFIGEGEQSLFTMTVKMGCRARKLGRGREIRSGEGNNLIVTFYSLFLVIVILFLFYFP